VHKRWMSKGVADWPRAHIPRSEDDEMKFFLASMDFSAVKLSWTAAAFCLVSV
jgi:hypothetical protein